MTQHKKGFTLVELSIVLIIIGLIIGGVLKGADMINSAKQKKIYNTWIKGWQVTINGYQDRTGQILADGPALVNGGNTAAANGTFDNRNLSIAAQRTVIENRLRAIGLDIPVTNITGNSGSYSIEGKYVTSTATMQLQNIAVNTNLRNIIQIQLVPTDVALAIDTMIDGAADAGLGNCLRNTAVAPAVQAPAQWPNAQTTPTVTMFIVL
jgi:prepilin-type N-terminal cleavage/methylation domain-containing protein